jgi:small-conductance mechanosensitive channel
MCARFLSAALPLLAGIPVAVASDGGGLRQGDRSDGGAARAAVASGRGGVARDGGVAPGSERARDGGVVAAAVTRENGTKRKPKPKPKEKEAPKPVAAPAKATNALKNKAIQVLDLVHDAGEKAVRRIDRVQDYLKRGDVSAALRELDRAKRAARNVAESTEDFKVEEVLTTTDYIVRILLSVGIGILALVVAWLFGVALRRLIFRDGAGAGMRWAYRTLVFVFTLGFLALGAWLAVRHVWKVRVSPARVLDALEHPLFAFEGRPVTPLSVCFFILTLPTVVVLAGRLRHLVEKRVMPRFSTDLGVQHAASTILYYVLLFVGLLIALEVLGVGASTVAILAGVVGLGIGFGMQHIINNFLSGFVLFFERPVKVGDIVDVAGVEGRVERIRARATTIITRDHVTIIVPNSDFVQNRVLNLSVPDDRVRFRLKVGVAYGSDPEKVRRVLLAVAAEHPRVLKSPPPDVQIADFADSAISFELVFWVSEILHRFKIASDLRYAIVQAFRDNAIQIPFPQRDLHVFPTEGLRAMLGRPGDGGASVDS